MEGQTERMKERDKETKKRQERERREMMRPRLLCTIGSLALSLFIKGE